MQDSEDRAPGMTRLVLNVPTELIERVGKAQAIARSTPSRGNSFGFWSAQLACDSAERELVDALHSAVWRQGGGEVPEPVALALSGCDHALLFRIKEDHSHLRDAVGRRTPVDAAADAELGERAAKALAGSAVA